MIPPLCRFGKDPKVCWNGRHPLGVSWDADGFCTEDECPPPLEAKDDLDEVLLALTPEQAAEIAIERGVPLVDVIRAYRKILAQAVEVADITFRQARYDREHRHRGGK